jgi:hypothetical protein
MTMNDEGGEVNIVYEGDRCTALWLEVTHQTDEGNDVKRKIPIIPLAKHSASLNRKIPAKAKFKLVASVGRGGFLRADVIY